MFSIQTIDVHHPSYPRLLQEIRYAPKVLYARGNVKLLSTLCMGIVGTRSCTPYGEAMTRYFTRTLASEGLTIVSGLAFGIDGLSHAVALEVGGNTIAVLGNSIDMVQPPRHESLANAILKQGGLLLSEYAPGTPYQAHHFPARNRLISGLSLGTLIVEAPEKSGALITARRAFEQNREVFTVPGDLTRESFKGNHHLLASDMARLVRTPAEILYYLGLKPKPARPKPPGATPSLDPEKQRVWSLLSENEPKTLDELTRQSKLPLHHLRAILTYLELYGHITALGNDTFLKVLTPDASLS